MLLPRAMPIGLLLILAFVLAAVSSLTSAASTLAEPPPSPESRLFESTRIRLATGKIVPAGAFAEQVVVREEPDGSALAFVGAPSDDEQRGAIYVYARGEAGGWRWTQTLLSDDVAVSGPSDSDTRHLGASLALDGNRLLAGTPFHHWQHGAAFLFERDEEGRWMSAGKLMPTYDWSLTRGFGTSVALHGDRALVGSFHDDNGQGAAYVFERQDDGRWRQVQRIPSHHRVTTDASGWPKITRFGATVALDDDTALIGATMASRDRGAATVYTLGSDGRFGRRTELRPDRDTEGFGVSVALEGDRAVVGSRQDAYYYGAAYVYARSEAGGWSMEQMLAPAGRFSGDRFGMAISLDGDRIAVGATGRSGTAYVYKLSDGDWWNVLRLAVPVEGPRPVFGRSVALAGDTLLVGDIGDTDRCPTADGCHTGAVHAYRLSETVSPIRLDGRHEQKLVVAAGTVGARSNVAAYDDLVLVADAGADDACITSTSCNSGAVHVLEAGRRGGWVETQRILAADMAEGAHFGAAVARDEDWLAIGAPGRWADCAGESCGSSAVYLYRRGTSGGWVAAQRIPSPLDEPGYGTSVALRGRLLVIGRSQHRARSQVGSVHVFRLDEGSGTWRVAGTHAVRSAGSRIAVEGLAIAGGQILVHTVTQSTAEAPRSGVSVLEVQSGRWTEQQLLADSRIVAPYLAADGGVLAVSMQVGQHGEVHVYFRDDAGLWTPGGVLRAPEGEGPWFGSSISVSGRNVLVGEGAPDASGPGAAHRFHSRPGESWRLIRTLRPADPDESGAFGSVVSIGGRTAIIGAPGVAARPDTIPGHVTIYRRLDPLLYLPALNPR